MRARGLLLNLLLSGLGIALLTNLSSQAFSDGDRPAQQKPQDGSFSIKVDVDLVILNVNVMDEKGVNVTNLKREDFVIYEDDVEQEVADFLPVEAPFNLVLMLDTSNSTRSSLSLIKKAALSFTDELRARDRIAVSEINFFVRQLQDFTSDRRTLKRVIDKVTTYPYGGSKVYDGVANAVKELHKLQLGRKAVVILSDGMENSSSIKFEELRRLLAQNEAVLYPVTILNKDRQKNLLEEFIRNADEKKPELEPIIKNARDSLSVLEEVYAIQTERMQTLADETGGKLFLVNNLSDLAGQYSKVAQELRNTFSLAYYSNNNWHDGTIRKVRVEVKNPSYQVRTRTSYFVPKD